MSADSGSISDPAPLGDSGDHLQALLELASDSAGPRSFVGYRWQAKIAVLRWLGCLGTKSAPEAVVCEHVDDVVSVFPSGLVFEQLKTKDRGSWSVSGVCAKHGGLDSLVRSYNTARAAGRHTSSRFQLSLEGASATGKATGDLFANPAGAGKPVKDALVAHGLNRSHVTDFLTRLRIRTGLPPRATIDAVLEQTVGALWPSLTFPERREVIRNLLEVAEAAQAHTNGFQLADALQLIPDKQVSTGADPDLNGAPSLPPQVLTRQQLVDQTPPLPGISAEDVLRRLARGESTSALELKLTAAGASKPTIEKAKSLRAQADVKRQLALAAGDDATDALRELEERVLMFGEGAVTKVALQSTSPGIAGRPAEFVFSDLMTTSAAGMAALDHDRVMAGQPMLILGLLCQISDECRYWWRP